MTMASISFGVASSEEELTATQPLARPLTAVAEIRDARLVKVFSNQPLKLNSPC